MTDSLTTMRKLMTLTLAALAAALGGEADFPESFAAFDISSTEGFSER